MKINAESFLLDNKAPEINKNVFFITGNDESVINQVEKKVLENTTSGGVTLNDVIWHIGQEELPFGGVGPSGTGSYHGHDGFKEFSHAKAVYKQFSADLMAQMMPPYKGKMFESMKNQILKK